MDATEKIAWLIKRHIEGEITPDESAALLRWRQDDAMNEALFQRVTQGEEVFADALLRLDLEEDDSGQRTDKIRQKTFRKIKAAQPIPTPRRRFTRTSYLYPAAAALLLCITFFGYYQWREQPQLAVHVDASEILPGTNKAELTLSNGQKITLRSDKDGIMLNKELTYSDGTPLLAVDKEKLAQTTASITVPVGGRYTVTLSDGTRVYLNAQSTLVYPLQFATDKRRVRIEGEAYFEVAQRYTNQQVRIPFEVACKDQVIRVTGTSFNVSAYADDAQTLTTLVEGSVAIHAAAGQLSLRPNEQATVQGDRMAKKQVDVQQYIAWKDNNFLFFETELRDLMKQVSRWYAIEVSYPKTIPPTYFYGEISREKNLAEVLRILEKSGVQFKLHKTGETTHLQIKHE